MSDEMHHWECKCPRCEKEREECRAARRHAESDCLACGPSAEGADGKLRWLAQVERLHAEAMAEAERLKGERDALSEAVRAVLADPHGCPMCDSGKLRKSVVERGADHWPECAYPKLRAALQKAGVLP